MKKAVSFVLVVLFCLLALPSFALFAENNNNIYVDKSKIDIAVSLLFKDPFSQSQEVELQENVLSDTVAADGFVVSESMKIRFSSDAFIPGARYYFSFVLYFSTGSGTFDPDPTGNAGFYNPSGTNITKYLSWGGDVKIDPDVDSSVYPETFQGLTAEEYANGNVLISGSFIPSTESGDLWLTIPIDNGYHFAKTGYAYLEVYANIEEVQLNLLSSINLITQNIYGSVEKTYNYLISILSTINTNMKNGFNTIHEDLVALTNKLSESLILSDADSKAFDDMDSEMDQAVSDAKDKLNQTNSAVADKKQESNKQKDQLQQSEQKQDDFKDSFIDMNAGSEIMESLDGMVNSYAGGLYFWGDVFAEFLSFEPFRFLLQVSVFFSLMMYMMGASLSAYSNSLKSKMREERSDHRHQDRLAHREAGG
ncbi:MAG: hypothetical protein E7616_04430 [Ruminococcaceae bacterium]|nr:hypothetical protein [Oscillospiraceae bacterium]